MGLRGKLWVPVMIAALAAALFVAPAHAQFPYGSGADHSLAAGTVPNDLSGDDNDWKFAATPEAGSLYTTNAQELNGVRGAHVVDADPTVATAWQTTTGRADVTIAVLDSGIKWNDGGGMNDLRRKARLNRGELPLPQGCPNYDCNGDGVFNVSDYS